MGLATGSGQLGLFCRVHCLLLPALQAQGLWGLNLGRLDQVSPPLPPKQGPAPQHLPAPAGPFPATAWPGQSVRLCRAGQGSPGIVPGVDKATSIAVTFLRHSLCCWTIPCHSRPCCHYCSEADRKSVV